MNKRTWLKILISTTNQTHPRRTQLYSLSQPHATMSSGADSSLVARKFSKVSGTHSYPNFSVADGLVKPNSFAAKVSRQVSEYLCHQRGR
jgi:hypothetical protein